MTYFNVDSRSAIILTKNIESPAPGDTTEFAYTLSTSGRGGLNDVDVFVNPKIVPEQYYENNILELSNHLNVEVDEFSPVIEVTVDGRILVNNDFVSPNPRMVMRMWDENDIVLKTDTSGIQVFLTYPCDADQCDAIPIYFSRDDVEWFAATDTSDFSVVFSPIELPDGLYRLSVEIPDGSGNMNNEPYTITFQVSRESSVIIQAPYPNPSTQFVTFTIVMTGDEAPDEFFVEIFSVDGRKVSELENLQTIIGTNEITWDGSNNNGVRLPAGIYFYRILLRKNGNEVPVKVPVNATYFSKGYGKLMLAK
jgi:hypothetical protein